MALARRSIKLVARAQSRSMHSGQWWPALHVARKCAPRLDEPANLFRNEAFLTAKIEAAFKKEGFFKLDEEQRQFEEGQEMLTSLNSIAVAQRDAGNLTQSQSLFQQLVDGRRKNNGDRRPAAGRGSATA